MTLPADEAFKDDCLACYDQDQNAFPMQEM